MHKICVSLLVLACLAANAAKLSEEVRPTNFDDVVNPEPETSYDSEYDPRAEFKKDDMMLDKNQEENRNAQSKYVRALWEEGIVYYEYDPSVKPKTQRAVEAAIADFHEYTCIKILPRKDEPNYILVKSDEEGCFAHMGRKRGQQPLNLETNGCSSKGTAIHELTHSLGFYHEHNRSDRDNYVRINWEKVEPGRDSAYGKLDEWVSDNQGFPYDFASIMHYDLYGFTIDGSKTIEVLDKANEAKLGQRRGFSKQDVLEINKFYEKECAKRDGVDAKPTAATEGANKECKDQHPDYCKDWGTMGDGYHCKNNAQLAKTCPETCGKC